MAASSETEMIIVIPTHDRADLLARTIDSLGKCNRPATYQRTIVIENGPTSQAQAIAEQAASWLQVEYLHHCVANKSSALNRVLEHVENELLVFFDDDVRVREDTLEAYAAAAVQHPQQKFFGGPTGVDYESPPPDWLRNYLPASATGWQRDSEESLVDEPCLLGFNWAAYAKDLRHVGGFDTRVGPGGTTGARGQEATMQVALLKNGIQGMYVPEAFVWHYVPLDRCSQDWALRRIYQSGMAQGIRGTSKSSKPFGIPRWMLRELLTSYLDLAANYCFGGARAFRSKYRLQTIRGRIRGAREKATRISQDTPPETEESTNAT